MPKRLFVYGTLLPGRAPTAMRDVVERMTVVGPATVRGRLYDLGAYPGLVLDPAGGSVSGLLVEVPDEPELWQRLNHYEGYVKVAPHKSLFRLVSGEAQRGTGEPLDCEVYVYNGLVAESRRIESGVWRPDATRSSETPSMTPTNHRRPLIGITLDYRRDKPERYEGMSDYAASVERAGGLPMFLPFRADLSLIPQMVDALGGVLFTGGDDLDPSLYGEALHRAEPLDPARQQFEMALLAEVERRRTPALGICLGSQLMNVHRGGSLIQFLPDVQRDSALDHRRDPHNPTRRHPVRIESNTVLAQAVGKQEVQANSRHKQAVAKLGRGLRVNAMAPDGVIEGFEDPSMPLFLAIQWHPENLSTEPEHLAPFKLLVEKATHSKGG